MSETVRTLIKSAFMRSTVRGLGDTPDDAETRDALDMLNEILDVLCRKEDFSLGMEDYVLDVPVRGFITFSDNSHRVFSASADNGEIRCVCGDSHGLVAGDTIVARIGGRDIESTVTGVVSYKEFLLPPDGGLSGRYLGSFKLATESDEFLIDIIGTPPVNIFQVVGSGDGEIPECKQQNFYSVDRSGKWWFYSKGNTPYPRLYISGCSRIKVVFERPFPRRVNLDTDLEGIDPAAISALKYRLAAEIAASAGYDEKEKNLLNKWKNAYATFARSKHQSEEADPDTSMAGYGRGGYDIYNDGEPYATF